MRCTYVSTGIDTNEDIDFIVPEDRSSNIFWVVTITDLAEQALFYNDCRLCDLFQQHADILDWDIAFVGEVPDHYISSHITDAQDYHFVTAKELRDIMLSLTSSLV